MRTQLLNHLLLQGVKTAAEGPESTNTKALDGVNTVWWVANGRAKHSGAHENKALLDHITA